MSVEREVAAESPRARSQARTRILETAYELFCRHGIRGVGIDRIVAESGVAKMTLYRHFRSKDELVLAFLDLREERWTHDWLTTEIERRAAAGEHALLAVFDAFADWFRDPHFEGCPFLCTLLEMHDTSGPVHMACVRHLEVVLDLLRRLAAREGVADPDTAAHQIQILAMGAIISACRGDLEAAGRSRAVAAALLDNGRA